MTESFKDYPKSLTEEKATRTKLAKDWTPRDALIDLLREIDSGRVELSAIVIAGLRVDGSVEHRTSSGMLYITLGLLERAKFKIMTGE